jgi:Carboxypeptidase regulatory-like domain
LRGAREIQFKALHKTSAVDVPSISVETRDEMNLKPLLADTSELQIHKLIFAANGSASLLRRLAGILALLVIMPASGNNLFAQTGGQGALQGTVTDSTGAVIPGASVTATDEVSGDSTTRQTSSAGFYTITPLTPDTYTVTVTANGFEVSKQENIVVNGLNVTGYNAKLLVGSTKETVTVTQAPPDLQTENGTLGTVIDNKTYESLPVLMSGSSAGAVNSRDPTAFATLSTGTQSGIRAPVFAGTGNYLAEVYLDGIPTTTANQQGDNRIVSMSMPVESIDQLQVVSSSATAEYQGAGAVGFTSQSGGKKYHGTILDVIRNTAFDTWGFTAPAATVPSVVNGVATTVPAPKPVEHQNELSLSVGGPIPFTRHKAFFFVNYDKYKGTNGVRPSQFTVPTTKMTQGDFSELLGTNAQGIAIGAIYDPLTTATCTAHNSAGTPCRYQYGYGPGNGTGPNGNPVPTGAPINVIPASEISPISIYEQKFLPAPTSVGIANNYLGGGVPTGYNSWELVSKFDYDVTKSQRVSFLFTHGDSTNFGYGANLPLPYVNGDTYNISPTMIVLEHSFVITPHLVNQFKYAFTRFPQPVLAPTGLGVAQYSATAAGITGLPVGQASANFPGTSFASSTSFPSGQTGWTQGGAADASHNVVPNAFTLVDNLQWSKGKHSITFGGEMQWLEDTESSQTTPSGIYTQAFSPTSTSNFSGTSLSSTYTGYSYASFLLGAVNSGGTSVPLFTEESGRYRPISPYVTDDWKIRPNLTLNLGLRYDYLPPFHEVQDRFSFFNPTAINSITNTPGQLEFAGNRGADISCECRTPVHTYWKNFGPRLGFAWTVNPKTVVRGGYSLSYSRAGGVGGRGGDGTGTGQTGFGSSIILPPAISTGVNSGPSYYLNNSPTFQAAGLANTNFGGPGFVIPPVTGPNVAALTLGIGNYVNSAGAYVTPGGAPAYADPYLSGRAPEFEFFNFGMQRSLTKNINIQVNYAGSQSHFVAGQGVPGFWSGQINPAYVAEFGSVLATDHATNILNAQATPQNIAIAQAIDPSVTVPYSGYAAAGAISSTPKVGRMLQPFPQYSGAPGPEWDNIANLSYNSIQITLHQREWRGLSYTLNYTYSKGVGDDGGGRSAWPIPAAATTSGVALPGNNREDRGLTAQDQPQNLNIYGVDNLPFGKGHIGGDHMLVRALAGGWALSGVFTYNSGNPISFSGSGCTFPSAGCYPDINTNFSGSIRRNGSFGKGITAAHLNAISYLNPAAFVLPQAFPLPAGALSTAVPITKIGDSPRYAYNAFTPGNYNLSLSIRRSFNITKERVKFLFQADSTNVTNKVSFGGISTGWSSAATSTFGQISTATGNRDFQFSGRITF